MDFTLTEEQQHLSQVVRDLAERECPAELVRRVVEKGDDGDSVWQALRSMELPGLTVPTEHHGSGATMVELSLVLEQLGRAADPSPFLATTTQYLPLVRDCTTGDVRARRLEAISGGGTGAAVFELAGITASRDGDGWVLGGSARNVVDGDRADDLAVVADTGDGLGVFLVPGDDVARERSPIGRRDHARWRPDLRRRAGARRPRLPRRQRRHRPQLRRSGGRGGRRSWWARPQRAFDLALDHIRNRKQFGVPIGSFQALKHMAVDVYVGIEKARALYQFAALAIAENDPRRAVASIAGQSRRRRRAAHRRAARHPVLRGARLHVGERPAALHAPGQGRRLRSAAVRRAPPFVATATLADSKESAR